MECSGTIELQNLEQWFEYDYIMSQDERLWNFIAKLDTEGDGTITLQNIEDAIRHVHGQNEAELGEYLTVLKEIFADEKHGYEKFAQIFRADTQPHIFADTRSQFTWSSSQSESNSDRVREKKNSIRM